MAAQMSTRHFVVDQQQLSDHVVHSVQHPNPFLADTSNILIAIIDRH